MVGQLQIWIANLAVQAHAQQLAHGILAVLAVVQQQPQPSDICYQRSLCVQDVIHMTWLAQLQVTTPSNTTCRHPAAVARMLRLFTASVTSMQMRHKAKGCFKPERACNCLQHDPQLPVISLMIDRSS